MFRGLVRLILFVVIVGGLGAFLMGYRVSSSSSGVTIERPIGATGAPVIDATRAREAGAELGEKVAAGATEAGRALTEARLTAKIKSKMALDDTVEAAAIDVDVSGSVATLTGRVPTEAAHTRAVQLARETDGVTSVVDHLTR